MAIYSLSLVIRNRNSDPEFQFESNVGSQPPTLRAEGAAAADGDYIIHFCIIKQTMF